MVSIATVSLFAQDVDSSANKTALIGSVDKKGPATLTIKDKKGSSIVFTTNANTQVLREGSTIALSNLVAGDVVAAIATESGGIGTESAKVRLLQKLYVGEATFSAKTKQQVVQGIVTGINDGVVTIAKFSKQDQFYNIPLDTSALIKTLDAKEASSSSLTLGLHVAVVGTVDASDIVLTPTLIQILGKQQ